MKFVDGLANVAGKYAPRATATKLVVPALVDPHDLLAEVLAVQQPQKSFRHSFDPLKYILFRRFMTFCIIFSAHPDRALGIASNRGYDRQIRTPCRHLARSPTVFADTSISGSTSTCISSGKLPSASWSAATLLALYRITAPFVWCPHTADVSL